MAHSANFTKLTFMVVFGEAIFRPSSAAPVGNCPLPLSYASDTPLGVRSKNCGFPVSCAQSVVYWLCVCVCVCVCVCLCSMWLGRHHLLPSGSLQIESIQSTDEGVYRCIAVNPVSNDRLSADNTVTLRTPPGQCSIPTIYYYYCCCNFKLELTSCSP